VNINFTPETMHYSDVQNLQPQNYFDL
jgi:hypothetical protein